MNLNIHTLFVQSGGSFNDNYTSDWNSQPSVFTTWRVLFEVDNGISDLHVLGIL